MNTQEFLATAASYLVRLTELFSGHLDRAHRMLALRDEPIDEMHQRQFHVGWKLPTDGWLHEQCPAVGRMVYDGRLLTPNPYDPIASIDRLAEQFAHKVIETKGRAYSKLIIPIGLQVATQHGPFRLLASYDIGDNVTPVRIDMMVAARLPHA